MCILEIRSYNIIITSNFQTSSQTLTWAILENVCSMSPIDWDLISSITR